MTVGKGKNMSEWLGKVTEDQNLNQLSELSNIPYDTLRQLFLSAVLQPGLDYGYLDPLTNKPVLGPPINDHYPYERAYSSLATSAQDHDFVIPDGETWEIVACSTVNVTQASQGVFWFTPDNGTTYYVVPGVWQPGSSATANTQSGIMTSLVLTGSGTNVFVRCSALAFAGGNVRKSTIAYRRLS